MYLENLPREDGESREVIHLRDLGHYIDVTLTSCLLHDLDPESWLKAFQEHYNQTIGDEVECESYQDNFGRAIKIPPEEHRIKFIVDLDHSGFKFGLRSGDEVAQEIIYGFLERILA